MTFIGLSGARYRLEPEPFNSGGEGGIYRVTGPGESRAAKIYNPGVPTLELQKKLIIMTKKPPNPVVLEQVAWPLDVLYDDGKQFRGFVMPELNINAELMDVYKYPPALNLNSLQKLIIAQNICVVISEIHAAGYVFGDFNPRNIGVNLKTGKVAFLDTDTYHVTDDITHAVYRCNVCAPGYAAPELLNKCFAYMQKNPNDRQFAYAKTPLPTFTRDTDNFSLAIHTFKILMNGYTPYGGIKDSDSVSQASPGVGDTAIIRDSYCFKPGNKPQSPAILPLDAFPGDVAEMFTRAFVYGNTDPKYRPTAVEWHWVLSRYETGLVTCTLNPLHQYHNKNNTCPLCEADRRFYLFTGQAPPPPPTGIIMQRSFNDGNAALTEMQPSGFYNNQPESQTPAPVPDPLRIPEAARDSHIPKVKKPETRPEAKPEVKKEDNKKIFIFAAAVLFVVFAAGFFLIVSIFQTPGSGSIAAATSKPERTPVPRFSVNEITGMAETAQPPNNTAEATQSNALQHTGETIPSGEAQNTAPESTTPAPAPTPAGTQTAAATNTPIPATTSPAVSTQTPAAHASATQAPATQTPATQAPATQATQTPATQAPTPPPDFEYTISGNTVIITGYKGQGGRVAVPESIEGKSVTAIGEGAFAENNKITGVTLPNSVTSIGFAAFAYSENLSSVTIPANVTSIGEHAFEGCAGLTGISLPNGITAIKENTFYGCGGLTSVTIPNNVTVIGKNAFYGCGSLRSVTLPSRLTSIGEGAFGECGLSGITIPGTVTSVGAVAFAACSRLTEIIIPSSVTSIGMYAFWNCTSLTGASLPASLTSMGEGVFEGCGRLTATVPAGSYAQEYCERNGINFRS